MADDKEEVDTHDPHYDPIIQLPDKPVDITTCEEDEDEILKLRGKLFRFDTSEPPGEWKERGTGDVKLLRHQATRRVRIVMRRDKTLKMCANHYITNSMNLIPNAGSDRAWVWHTTADFADGETKEERLAIRFANAENALKFKSHFNDAKAVAANENGAGEGPISESEDEDEDEKEADTSKDKDDQSEKPVAESAASQENDTTADQIAEKLGEVKIAGSTSSTDGVADKLGEIKIADSNVETEKESDQKVKEGDE